MDSGIPAMNRWGIIGRPSRDSGERGRLVPRDESRGFCRASLAGLVGAGGGSPRHVVQRSEDPSVESLGCYRSSLAGLRAARPIGTPR